MPDDHAELLRLRDRIHAIADNTTVALGRLREELHDIGTRVEIVAERVKAHTEQHHEDISRLERKMDNQAAEHDRRFEELAQDQRTVRRGLYTLAFSAISAALIVTLGLYALFGN